MSQRAYITGICLMGLALAAMAFGVLNGVQVQ